MSLQCHTRCNSDEDENESDDSESSSNEDVREFTAFLNNLISSMSNICRLRQFSVDNAGELVLMKCSIYIQHVVLFLLEPLLHPYTLQDVKNNITIAGVI